MEAAPEDEIFDVYELTPDGPLVCESGERLRKVGQERRGAVHGSGRLHASVNVFVLCRAGDVLLQKRSAAKRIYPAAWDLSCAEHLQPGEAFRDAAIRGLEEELGLRVSTHYAEADLTEVRSYHLFRTAIPALSIDDYEVQALYVLRLPLCHEEADSAMNVNPNEVASLCWKSPKDLDTLDPSQVTSWFTNEWDYIRRTFV